MGVHFKENEERITLWMIITGIAIIAILLTSLIIYLLKSRTNDLENYAHEEQIVGEVKQDNDDEFETVSIDIGKSVNEATNELNNSLNNAIHNTSNEIGNESNNLEVERNKTNTASDVNENINKSETQEVKKEIKFNVPIKGEIIREFAPDSLVYSETLQEWITHNGVDIKADKTSVVTAAADGMVHAIKNDPRYGLTVIVNHEDGYQTIYANLLTAEYVVEGEQISAGQTIGTIGNSATFEISDEYHLHFEMLQEGDYINPINYMEF